MPREEKTYYLDDSPFKKLSHRFIDYAEEEVVRYYRMVEKGFQKYNFYVQKSIYIERKQLPRELPEEIYIKEGGYDD